MLLKLRFLDSFQNIGSLLKREIIEILPGVNGNILDIILDDHVSVLGEYVEDLAF